MKYLLLFSLICLLQQSCINKPVENNLGGYISDEEEYNSFASPLDKNTDSLIIK